MSYDSAFAYVKSCRPCIKPNSGFVKCLQDWEVKCSSHRSQSISAPPPMRRAQTESVPNIPLYYKKTVYLTGIHLSGYCQFVGFEPPNCFFPSPRRIYGLFFFGTCLHRYARNHTYYSISILLLFSMLSDKYLSCNNIHFLGSEFGKFQSFPLKVHGSVHEDSSRSLTKIVQILQVRTNRHWAWANSKAILDT
jgi:hypothetical protein